MRGGLFLALFLGFASLAGGSLLRAQSAVNASQPAASSPAYFLKAPAKWAEAIDKVLAEIAQPMRVTVPMKATPEEYLSQFCADETPSYTHATSKDPSGRTVLTMTPCVRVRRDVQVPVTAGDTLEGLAVRSGLPRSTAQNYKVSSGPDEKPKTIAPEQLKVGDVVWFPEVPVWTTIVTKPDVPSDRASIVRAIANAVLCREKDADACLARHGIELIERAAPKPVAPKGPPDHVRNFAPYEPHAPNTEHRIDDPEQPVGTIPVAPEQWPYDVNLLAKILSLSQAEMTMPTVIGIADGGLGNGMAGPLHPDYFWETSERKLAKEELRIDEPNKGDDDQNKWIDDLFGAGVDRPIPELVGSGDVALCGGTPPDFKSWPTLKAASHGTAVSAIAAARRVRFKDPAIIKLPRLLFFRMVAEACDPAASLNIGEGEWIQAYEYLEKRADILSISYKFDTSPGSLTSRVKDLLPFKDALLFVPAGNDFVGDLDDKNVCPACLGNANKGDKAARRVVVVGAATRALKRESFSNFGEQTVKLFAPGEPMDAIDLSGADLPAADSATSYSTPYAALAAAIIRSFGRPTGSDAVRDRLEASTWPLDDQASNTAKTGVGVIDLVKAAATRFYSIEVKEPQDGSWVRKTYVGKLKGRLQELRICNEAFKEVSYHAIRLSEPDTSGRRTIRLYPRQVPNGADRRGSFIHATDCRSSGQLVMTTVFDKEETFPLDAVLHIQAPWYEQ